MSMLTARDGYRLWAASYAVETAITYLEDRLVAAVTPPLTGLRLLDAGCGTGRRLRGIEAASVVGIDLCAEMLEAGEREAPFESHIRTMVGDVQALPFPDRAFDMVWCRLVIGHLPECQRAYAELARVADAGACVIVSDFHPRAHAAGHRRTFRANGVVHEVEHYRHEVSEHLTAAAAAGLETVAIRKAEIGPDVRSFYEKAGREALYADHFGLPVVLALTFRRRG